MLITDREELQQFNTSHRLWQGIPGIEISEKGRLFATFYSGGTKEEFGNYCLLIISDDDGYTWSEPVAVAYNGPASRCYDPFLWMDVLGRLWFIWSIMPEHAVYASLCNNPDADILNWSKPFIIGKDVMMNKPTFLSTGEIMFPIAVWDRNVQAINGCVSEGEERLPFVYRSTDCGTTFEKLGGPKVEKRSFDEHMILELSDGRLMMFIRTLYGIGKSYSYDGGRTWTDAEPSGFGGPCTRFYIRKLSSGSIFLIYHDSTSKRSNLAAYLSEDEGETWKWKLLLDERDNVSYPDAVEAKNGYIYIIYDRERGAFCKGLEELYHNAREILMAKITEEDIIAGKIVSKDSRLKQTVSKLGVYLGPMINPYSEKLLLSTDEYVKQVMELPANEKMIDSILEDFGRCSLTLDWDTIQNLNAKIEYALNLDKKTSRKELEKTIREILSIFKKGEEANPVDLFPKMIAYINNNLCVDLSLDEMAQALHLSKFYMCHLFKEKAKITIMNYRNARRIQLSKKQLATTELSITDIALSLGYTDAAYFSKLFMQYEGMTPTQYRKTSRKINNMDKGGLS
ncbi:MAG: helix-turn-helix domain-containing protein [Clostridiaceae bacterium]|nr:helix-turn-helix domain-containing protein [Clostridiaceae bacterium]